MGQTESYESQVRVGHSLSEAEKQHVNWRKENVLLCLEEHGITCNEDELPNIALLGSGGGMRAMVALLGSLCQLADEGLLDSVMYLSGVSGSTWCMASLYKEPEWSVRLESIKDGIVERLANGEVTFQEQLEKLVKYSKKDNFSMTDVWAVFISGTVKEIDEHVLSELREEHSEDPYPIYTVIDQQFTHDDQSSDVWFEITPDEAGYSLTGAFVNSSYLGSEFSKGLKTKTCPELDMLYLQGLCSGALAERETITKWVLNWLRNLMGVDEIQATSPEPELKLGCQIISTLLDFNISALEEQDISVHITAMKELMKGKKFHDTGIYPGIWMLEGKVTQKEVKEFTLNVCSSFPDWFPGCDHVVAVAKAIQQGLGWTWGTTYNYLHDMTVKDVTSSVLHTKTRRYEDAGLLLNSPYFSVLRKERDVDLIISLDFSNGDPFETVHKAAEMCKAAGIAFPDIIHMHNPEPQDFYVFKGKDEAPTVIHIPLFNAVNCPGEVETWKNRYSSTTLHYTRAMISDLLEKSRLNIRNNKEKLLREIQISTENKKNKQATKEA